MPTNWGTHGIFPLQLFHLKELRAGHYGVPWSSRMRPIHVDALWRESSQGLAMTRCMAGNLNNGNLSMLHLWNCTLDGFSLHTAGFMPCCEGFTHQNPKKYWCLTPYTFGQCLGQFHEFRAWWLPQGHQSAGIIPAGWCHAHGSDSLRSWGSSFRGGEFGQRPPTCGWWTSTFQVVVLSWSRAPFGCFSLGLLNYRPLLGAHPTMYFQVIRRAGF